MNGALWSPLGSPPGDLDYRWGEREFGARLARPQAGPSAREEERRNDRRLDPPPDRPNVFLAEHAGAFAGRRWPALARLVPSIPSPRGL
jgi:hypothetical protein